nr:hypothetical protein [Tanacetum cinerariifolium]
MRKGLFGPNGERGVKVEVRFDNFRGGGKETGNYGANGGRGSSIFERGKGSLAICSMKSKDGLGGGRLVVVGGRWEVFGASWRRTHRQTLNMMSSKLAVR